MGAIGCNNELLYNIKEDMKFFKDTTMHHKVVMGYNTWVSLPKKPLPNRVNYILCDGDCDIEETENIKVLSNLEQVIELGKNDDIFIIGGAQLYNSIIDSGMLDEAYVTMVIDKYYSADRFVHIFKLAEVLPKREDIRTIKFKNYNNTLDAHIYKYSK
jgi:dihydrofolate reductase